MSALIPTPPAEPLLDRCEALIRQGIDGFGLDLPPSPWVDGPCPARHFLPEGLNFYRGDLPDKPLTPFILLWNDKAAEQHTETKGYLWNLGVEVKLAFDRTLPRTHTPDLIRSLFLALFTADLRNGDVISRAHDRLSSAAVRVVHLYEIDASIVDAIGDWATEISLTFTARAFSLAPAS